MTRPFARHALATAEVNDLLARARESDRDAFGELFRRYRRYAEAVARSSGAPDVEEAAAESFRLVVSAIDAGNGPTVAFGPYLATTVRSVARRQRQLAARHDIVEPTVLEGRIMDESASVVDPVMAVAFASLPERWQSIIWYVDIEGIPPRQVVDLVDVPSSNAASALLLRARAGLRVAYLEALVGGAHTQEVRAHLAGLVAGAATTVELELEAQWHLERCPECREIAARVAAIVGRGPSRQLAVSLVALMGFAPEADLIPSGAGLALGGFGSLASVQPGWLTVAASTVVVGGVLTVLAFVGGGGEAPGDQAAAFPTVETVSAAPPEASAQAPPPPARRATTTSSTTLAPSTTSTSSTTSMPPTTAPPVTVAVTPAPATVVPPTPTTVAVEVPVPTSPASTEAPAPEETPTSTPDTTTSTAPPDTTTTTTLTPSTTSTTTVAPSGPVGALGGGWTVVNESLLHIDLAVTELTGESGRVVFSAPMSFSSVSGASCVSPTECTFAGIAAPSSISIVGDTDVTSISIQLYDSAGNLDDTANAG